MKDRNKSLDPEAQTDNNTGNKLLIKFVFVQLGIIVALIAAIWTITTQTANSQSKDIAELAKQNKECNAVQNERLARLETIVEEKFISIDKRLTQIYEAKSHK